MTLRTLSVLSLLSLAAAFAACGGDDKPKAASAPAGAQSAGEPRSRYAMPADPKGAVSVLDAKKGGPKKDVVVVGRIKDMTPGFAAFTLTDVSLKYCGQDEGG